MLNLTISSVSYQKAPRHYAFKFSVHPVGVDKTDGLIYPTVKEAEAAAKAWVKANDKFNRSEIKAEAKAVESAEKAAERATKSVQKAAERAAEKLAAEAAILAEKKAKLDTFLQTGTFALVG